VHWTQVYDPFGRWWLSTLVATLPILVLFVLLVGLKVKPHPTCPDRYVLIEPGTAIDCCGREIVVGAEEYFGFEAKFLENWQKQNGPNSQPAPNAPHKIQICVSYKECGT